jgi:hypothetical protein
MGLVLVLELTGIATQHFLQRLENVWSL